MTTKEQMVEGKRYRVFFRHETQRYDREFVGTYLGWSEVMGDHQFNQRPAAGTSSLHPDSLIGFEEVGADVPHSCPSRRVTYNGAKA